MLVVYDQKALFGKLCSPSKLTKKFPPPSSDSTEFLLAEQSQGH